METTESIHAIVEREFDCEHNQTEIRYKTLTNGRLQYVAQCLSCGKPTTSAIAHIKVANKSSLREFDEALREAYYDLKAERRQELHDARRVDWFSDYSHYLRSSEWKDKRTKVLRRDNYTCQACLAQSAQQVHHLPGSYKMIPNEPLFLLVSVCTECHDRLTEVDKEAQK